MKLLVQIGEKERESVCVGERNRQRESMRGGGISRRTAHTWINKEYIKT